MIDPAILRMPAGFLWGAATAAHQNEGNNLGNQWAAWEQQAGRIYAGQRSGRATDWWDLETAASDFDRAAELGLNSLRVSVEWSRIEPEPGVFDQAALAHYREMIGLLRERGLEPMVTLHHFTDPLWLTGLGGWENPAIENYFLRFITHVVEALGDQVTLWCTINEPTVYAIEGYLEGYFPPGAKSLRRTLGVLRRMVLVHGRCYRTIHRLQNNAKVGLAHHQRLFVPANPQSMADRRAAALLDQVGNRAVLEAVTRGRLMPLLGVGEQVTYLIDACDFIGLNYYTPARVTFAPTQPRWLFTRQFLDPNAESSDETPLGEPYSEINARGLYLALKQVAGYGKPIYITENGLPDADDDQRPRFIATYLSEAWRALQEGVDLRGYYHWTLVDNFEWEAGWSLRFGLYEMDVESGRRSPRTSAAIYRRIAESNGVPKAVLERVAPQAIGTYFRE
jgi:beta-glucosidase